MNVLVRVAKMVFNSWRPKSEASKLSRCRLWATLLVPQMDWGKVPKYVGPGCSPFPPPVKESLLVMLVDASANSYIEFADVKILLLFCQLFCSSANNINKSMIFHNIHVNLSASSLLVLCLFITYPCFFLFSIKLWESLSDLSIMFFKQVKVF